MKTNIEIPHLEKVGINKSRFFAFIEIARHPNGLSIGEIAEKVGETYQATQFTITELEKNNYIRTEIRKPDNGRRKKTYCYATAFGIDNICSEMESLCRLFTQVRKEMICDTEKDLNLGSDERYNIVTAGS